VDHRPVRYAKRCQDDFLDITNVVGIAGGVSPLDGGQGSSQKIILTLFLFDWLTSGSQDSS
jgi:hypothetical protein